MKGFFWFLFIFKQVFELFRDFAGFRDSRQILTYRFVILLGVSLAYGRDDIKSLSGVCIILTSKIGQCSERRS